MKAVKTHEFVRNFVHLVVFRSVSLWLILLLVQQPASQHRFLHL
jgi:hypothetical protein